MSLLDKASLIVTPNAYKESKLYSVVPNTTLGDMDVVRATTATRVNSAGLIEVVPRNLLQFSEQLDNAIWTKSGVTITANSVNSPIETLTADLVTPTISDASLRQSFLPIGALQYNFSIWLRSSTGSNFSTTLRAWRDSPFQNISNVVINVTTEWRRFNFSFTTLDATTHTIVIGGSSTLSTGENFYSWGAQLDLGATATEYFPTTTRLNIPRIDYTNGSCPSLLVEPQRTNLATYSEQIDDASWVKYSSGTGINPVVTANNIASPSGVNNADKIVFNSGAGTTASNYSLISKSSIVTLNATSYTLSFYAKGDVGGEKLMFRSVGAGTFTKVTLTTSWQRFTITETSISISSGIDFGIRRGLVEPMDSSATVFIWGMQLELGSYPTSYIPTVASSVTRNVDVISKTGLGSIFGSTYTIYGEFLNQNVNTTRLLSLKIPSGGNYDNFITIFQNGTTLRAIGNDGSSVEQFSITSGSFSLNQKIKIALRCQNNNVAFYINGTQIGVDTSCTIPAVTAMYLGNYVDVFGVSVINSVAVFNSALTNTELVQLTTL